MPLGIIQRPKIAMLHYTCPPVVGGVESIMASHARLFAGQGYRVTIVAGRGPVPESDPSSNISTVIEPLIDSKNERLLNLNRELDNGHVPDDFAAYTDDIYERLCEQLTGMQAVIVHNALTLHKNLPLTAALFRLAYSPDFKGKLISWCHDLAWTNPLYADVLYEAYPWNLLKTADPNITYIAISPQRQTEIVHTFQPPLIAEQVPVVPNGVGVMDFVGIGDETRQILETSGIGAAIEQGATLLYLPARITRRKNIELGIKVVAALRDMGHDFRLIVTGPPGPHNIRNDEYVRELLGQREQLDVEDRAIFLMEKWANPDGSPRTVSDATIAELYRLVDALFFPSTQEGFGIPIIEAALLRLPIFCSDIRPFVELLGRQPTMFGLNDAPADIARLILTSMQNNVAAQQRALVLRNYTWERIFTRLIEPLVWK